MGFQKVEFLNNNNEKLAARLELPDEGTPKAFAIFAHCFTCTKNIKVAGIISKAIAKRGIAVLRFDFTGLGNSEGDFANTHFSSNVDDLLNAAKFLESEFAAPAILIGHSLGGAAVLRAAIGIPSARAVVTIGAPAEPAHLKRIMSESEDEILKEGKAEITIAGQAFTIKKEFLEDIESTRIQSSINELNRALMIFHAPMDQIVGIDNAAAIFKASRHPKSFISLDDADHLLSREKDAEFVANVISEWAVRYLE